MNEATQEGIMSLEQDFLSNLVQIWNFQLFAIEGSSITLGKLIIGLLLLVFGYYAANSVSKSLGRKVISRIEMDAALKYTLERALFYAIYFIFVLFTLQILSIPITIFTVMGGALAIGIGFGSQNLVNNFISGLIVMIERPVRVGDWIELDGVFGVVEQIGSRSTYMRSLENKQMIIPNSFFLDKLITNWTLNNNIVNGRVSIGVAYGSDLKLVTETLMQAAKDHPDVHKNPQPFVLFKDFGDSSLNFDLSFWISFNENVTIGRVSSDLRYKIDELFRVRNISIPFPHREVFIHNKN